MLFLVIARDGTDAEAPQRRQAVREVHLRGIQETAASGVLQVGGAFLNDQGQMIGSMLLIEAESRQALESYLQTDIYSQAGVWQTFEIHHFRRAV